MIKQNEIFVQVLRKDEQPAESMTVPPPPPPPKPGKAAAAPGPTH
jgi:cell division protein FtsB